MTDPTTLDILRIPICICTWSALILCHDIEEPRSPEVPSPYAIKHTLGVYGTCRRRLKLLHHWEVNKTTPLCRLAAYALMLIREQVVNGLCPCA